MLKNIPDEIACCSQDNSRIIEAKEAFEYIQNIFVPIKKMILMKYLKI